MNHPDEAYISLPEAERLLQALKAYGDAETAHMLSYQLNVLEVLHSFEIRMYTLNFLHVDEMFDVVGENGVDYRPVRLYDYLREEGPRGVYQLLRDWMRLWNAESYDIVVDYAGRKLRQGTV